MGCLWELAGGSKGVVQALGNAFGSLQTPPYGLLDGDGRSGAATGGENLLVNLDRLQQIRRIQPRSRSISWHGEGAAAGASPLGHVAARLAGDPGVLSGELERCAGQRGTAARGAVLRPGGDVGSGAGDPPPLQPVQQVPPRRPPIRRHRAGQAARSGGWK